MISKPVAHLLADLGVIKTHSRPHVSNDNPFSEAHFKTVKDQPSFPKRFGSREDAPAFFPWYNDEHDHTGVLGLLTPNRVQHSTAEGVLLRARHQVLLAAHALHPERFLSGPPEYQPHHQRSGSIRPRPRRRCSVCD